MPALFALTIFVSASLLFLVQPMVAKMILPKFGGTPAVWNTCMVFFQATLLAGYGYAHGMTTWLGVRKQAALHVVVLLIPLATLPILVSKDWAPPAEANPIPSLLGLLLVVVGLPFFVLSTSAPLLQKWFAGTGHASAKDPYFLYAASNAGSMLALLSYPFLLEPSFVLPVQSRYWHVGYLAFVALTACCAVALWRSSPEAAQRLHAREAADTSPPPSRLVRLHWIALAFVPSSMMLGVTAYMSMDIAAIPLIWVVPLALYLLSFILVFSRLPRVFHQMIVIMFPVVLLLVVFVLLSNVEKKVYVLLALHLGLFFITALMCHGELAQRRPSPRHLTEFYLWMSFGGVLGGLFCAVLAPLVFKSLAEYTITMAMACFLLPYVSPEEPEWLVRLVEKDPKKHEMASRLLDIALPLFVGLLALILVQGFHEDTSKTGVSGVVDRVHESLGRLGLGNQSRFRMAVMYGLPILLCYVLSTRPLRFGLGVSALLFVGFGYKPYLSTADIIHRDRSFFGVLKLERTTGQHSLVHGTTLHGLQRVTAQGKPVRDCEPSTYYHRTGPIGQVFATFERLDYKPPVAAIGLGTGSLATYAKSGQDFTFYEIDPAVVKIAKNPQFFTYLADCKERTGQEAKIVLGDARLSLAHAPNGQYGLIVVDAFSSDAIPVHLITREAIELYLEKLTPDGIMAFHVSNRHLTLEPVLANLAEHMNLAGYVMNDTDIGVNYGKCDSVWVILSRKDHARYLDAVASGHLLRDLNLINPADIAAHLAGMVANPIAAPVACSVQAGLPFAEDDSVSRWVPLKTEPEVGIWTDDFSNLLSVFSWRS